MLHKVSVSYKKRDSGELCWIDCEAATAKEAYHIIRHSKQHDAMLSQGYREYGIIGLKE